jgi:hypothetical protein
MAEVLAKVAEVSGLTISGTAEVNELLKRS